MEKKIKGVFFDCWDTLLQFAMKDERWNTKTLYDHCLNREEVDWDELNRFCDDFYHTYYTSHLEYELKVEQVLSLLVTYFSLKLDCPISLCTHEILIYLDPKPVDGSPEFLSFLEELHVPYGVLTNTVYDEEDTKGLLDEHFKGHIFSLVLASSKIGVKKPNPIFFKTGVKLAHLDIQDCLYIGDRLLQDCYGSYRAGFASSFEIDWKNHHERQLKEMVEKGYPTSFPHQRFSSYSEIKEYLLNHDCL